jgi:hypothetical protein
VEKTCFPVKSYAPRALLGLAVLVRATHVLLGVVAGGEVKDGAIQSHQAAVHEAGKVALAGQGVSKYEDALQSGSADRYRRHRAKFSGGIGECRFRLGDILTPK